MKQWEFTLFLQPGNPYTILVRALNFVGATRAGMRCARLETSAQRAVTGIQVKEFVDVE